jgi:hypothetical protein
MGTRMQAAGHWSLVTGLLGARVEILGLYLVLELKEGLVQLHESLIADLTSNKPTHPLIHAELPVTSNQ